MYYKNYNYPVTNLLYHIYFLFLTPHPFLVSSPDFLRKAKDTFDICAPDIVSF